MICSTCTCTRCSVHILTCIMSNIYITITCTCTMHMHGTCTCMYMYMRLCVAPATIDQLSHFQDKTPMFPQNEFNFILAVVLDQYHTLQFVARLVRKIDNVCVFVPSLSSHGLTGLYPCVTIYTYMKIQ